MIIPLPETTPTIKSSVNVFIKNESDGKVSAMVLGLPEWRVESSDRQSALADLQKLVMTSFTKAEVVSLEIEIPQTEHPWLRFAGVFKDDPYFEQMQEDIASYRRDKDTEFSEYHQFDIEKE